MQSGNAQAHERRGHAAKDPNKQILKQVKKRVCLKPGIWKAHTKHRMTLKFSD